MMFKGVRSKIHDPLKCEQKEAQNIVESLKKKLVKKVQIQADSDRQEKTAKLGHIYDSELPLAKQLIDQ